MGRVKPALVGILMALHAIVVHHQGARRDELAGLGDGFGGIEILLALAGSLDAEGPGILGMEKTHDQTTNPATATLKRLAHSHLIRGPASRCLT